MKILFFFLVFLSIFDTPTIAKPTHSFVFKLFQRDTLLAEMDSTNDGGTAISHLSPRRNPPVFLANISIGEPPVPQLLYVDIGSSFTWIKCRGCNTCQSQFQAFDPKASSTYKTVSCDDSSYESSPALSPIKRTGECRFHQEYLDGSESVGTLAKETLWFETDDDGIYSVPNVDFGCALKITHGFDVGGGLLGLAYGNFSILKHFDSKFSLCFGALSRDPNSGVSFLALGDDARITGKVTPLFLKNSHYHVDLETISVNGIAIPSHLTSAIGNTIIDTGTAILNLAGESYTELKGRIDNFIDEQLNSFTKDQLVCYNGTIQSELPLLPTVTLKFYKGATLELDPTTLFHQFEDGYFCLAMMKSPEISLNIIGTTALQNYNIGFDVKDETVYFDKISCDYLY